MSKTITGTAVNPSPTVTYPAGADLTNARYLAVSLSDGKVVLPAAGANVLGIAIGETDELVKTGEDVDVQIKDIGKWAAGAAIDVGDELATDATGKAVKATSGAFIVGVALTAATAAGSLVQVQIAKMGYKS